MGHLHNGILLGHKEKKILPFATVGMDLEKVMLRKETSREMPYYFTHVESDEQTEPTKKMGTDS